MKEILRCLGQLMATQQQMKLSKGRKVSAFRVAGGGCHELARAAYAQRFAHCKILAALDHGMAASEEPLGQVANACARRILWIFMHYCLPDYPGKGDAYNGLRALNNANKLIQGIERIITQRLSAGDPADAEFSTRVLDDEIFFAFAEEWLGRRRGNRAARPYGRTAAG